MENLGLVSFVILIFWQTRCLVFVSQPDATQRQCNARQSLITAAELTWLKSNPPEPFTDITSSSQHIHHHQYSYHFKHHNLSCHHKGRWYVAHLQNHHHTIVLVTGWLPSVGLALSNRQLTTRIHRGGVLCLETFWQEQTGQEILWEREDCPQPRQGLSKNCSQTR